VTEEPLRSTALASAVALLVAIAGAAAIVTFAGDGDRQQPATFTADSAPPSVLPPGLDQLEDEVRAELAARGDRWCEMTVVNGFGRDPSHVHIAHGIQEGDALPPDLVAFLATVNFSAQDFEELHLSESGVLLVSRDALTESGRRLRAAVVAVRHYGSRDDPALADWELLDYVLFTECDD
jgi:hypothetical protein